MSAEILSSLTDKRSEMRKQVGCMTGILQLLDRRHFLAGQRVGAASNKKLLTGGQHKIEPRSVAKMRMEKTVQTVSDHSSKIFPSSPSPSLAKHKTAQLESPSSTQTDPPNPLSTKSVHSGRHSPDLQDVVKESMHRESRSLSVEGKKVHSLKHIDSPRPLKPFDGSMRLPAKFQEAPSCKCRNSPRFSCDGTESRKERVKATMKQKDIPRLSLDSGLRSIRSTASQSRSNFLLGDTNKEFASHKRSSSVVAKLMGLESFPDSTSINQAETTIQGSFLLRPANSRLPLELAPWSQSDLSSPRVSLSVFGEIEKRITELEFKESGKDLRALKQILEAMHKTRSRNATYHVCCDQSPRLPVQATKMEAYPTKNFTLIERQDKRTGNTKFASSLVTKGEDKGRPMRNNVKQPNHSVPYAEKRVNGRTTKSVHSSKASEKMSSMQERSSSVVSPKIHKRKQGKDTQSHLNIPQSEPSRIRSRNKQTKPGQPNRRNKPKSNNLQHDDDQLSESSSGTRSFYEKGDTASVLSERNSCSVSYMEPEVRSRNHTTAIGDAKETNPVERLGAETTMTEIATAPTEQPSPVSVLDSAFYIEDSPSPVKKISTAFRDYEPNEAEWHNVDLDCSPVRTRNLGSEYNHGKFENIQYLVHKLSILNPDHEDSMNQIASPCQNDNFDHQYIDKIILASGLLKDSDCVSTPTELHPSGHLINPELFHVLEQTEDCTRLSVKNVVQFDQKIHRRIIFDTVNEILAHKLGPLMPRRRCLSRQQLLKELYAEIDYLRPKSNSSLEIEDDELTSIINADMKHESEDWDEHHCEIPVLVLSIERLIFKDLITEVIRGEGDERPRGHCRQLFT